ncbi:protein of unassigned function [Methylobacterium oryzae CBMB20]|uniref:Protein of unassigned function n=1 Tax=Methylobacterium oryzae CBMB20 TaxID=693986 RepID=A0A089NVD1_9HYPH|nr:protein of unassigned function [Methylobacterium oryzae CBMB20]
MRTGDRLNTRPWPPARGDENKYLLRNIYEIVLWPGVLKYLRYEN